MANLNITPTLSIAGTRGIFLNAAQAHADCQVQNKIIALAETVALLPHILETVPGVNSLLVVYDPMKQQPGPLMDQLRTHWQQTPATQIQGTTFEIPVYYGGARGEDLPAAAQHCGMSVEEFIQVHSAGEYQVACIGAMPGFPYLTGLDPRIAIARRSTPRLSLEGGSITIGGSHAGITPCRAPSGWHVIGHTPTTLFDAKASKAALLRPGDRIRFIVEGIAQ